METLTEKVRVATIIGTFQSTLTDFRYIRNIWKKNAEEERLLGVSLTGIMDHPVLSQVSKDAEMWLASLRETAIDTNKEWAEKLGIEQSAAVSCVKPSGCTTLDTEIRTGHSGQTISMRNIFKAAGYDEDRLTELATHSDEGMWLVKGREEIQKIPFLSNLFVIDENNEQQLITGLYLNGFKSVYEIEFEDGNTYKFTGNHKLKTTNGWKRVDELTEEDELVSYT